MPNMCKKLMLLISLCLSAHAAQPVKDLKSELLDVVTPVKPVQDIIWGYLCGWQAQYSAKSFICHNPHHAEKRLYYLPEDRCMRVHGFGGQLPKNSMTSEWVRSKFFATISYFDTKTGTQIRKISLAHQIYGRSTFSPDGTHIIAGRYEGVLTGRGHGGGPAVINAQTGSIITPLEPHENKNYGFEYTRFSPDGRYLLLVLNDTIELWDAHNYSYIKTIKITDVDTNYSCRVEKAVFSPDNKLLAARCNFWSKLADSAGKPSFSVLKIIDRETGLVLNVLDRSIPVTYCPLAWSPDNRYLTSGSPDAITIWEQKDSAFKLFSQIKSENETVYLRWLPVHSYLIARSIEHFTDSGPAKIYNIKTGTCVHTFDNINYITSSRDGRQIFALSAAVDTGEDFGAQQMTTWKNDAVTLQIEEVEKKQNN